VKDAEEHTSEDKKRRDAIDARNRADQMVYETEKNLKQAGANLDPDVKARVEAAVSRVKEAMKMDNVDEIRSATEALTQVWHDAAEKMYAKASPHADPHTGGDSSGGQAGPHAGAQAGTGERKDGDAVDADFEVVE